MEKLEVSTDNSMTGPDSISGVPSATSYNEAHSVVHSDAGSVASTSLQGAATGTSNMSSPIRSPPRSSPTSPASVAGSNATPQSVQQQRRVDLLDNNQYSQGYPTTRDRSGGLTSSDDDHTEPSSSATGTQGENPAGYTRSDFNSKATSTFGRLVENTKVSFESSAACGECGEVRSYSLILLRLFCECRNDSIRVIDGAPVEMKATMMTMTTC